MMTEDGRVGSAETGSREPSPSVSALPGFDPARIIAFTDALEAFPLVVERLARGQQFNAYESSANDDDDDDEDRDYWLGIGPVTDFGSILSVTGKSRAELLESAFKLAASAIEVSPAPSPEELQAGLAAINAKSSTATGLSRSSAASAIEARRAETQGGSVEDESAGPKDDAQTQGPSA